VTIVLPIQPEESADEELRQLYAHVCLGQINSTARVGAGIPRPTTLITDTGEEYPPLCARRRISFPIDIVISMQRRNGHYEQNEQTGDSGGFESLHSRRRPDLQRRILARHLLADHYAWLLDRHWRDVGLGLSPYLGLYGLFICEEGRGADHLVEVDGTPASLKALMSKSSIPNPAAQ